MRTIMAWSLCALVLAGCSGQSLLTLEVPQAEIQTKLNEKFPISPEGDGGGMPFKLTLSQPKVSLQEAENRIVLELAVEAALEGGSGPALPNAGALPNRPQLKPPGGPPPGPPGFPGPPDLPMPELPELPTPAAPPKSLTGKLVISGSPEFDLKEKALYIRDAKVVTINLDGLPPPLNEPLRNLAQEKVSEKFDTSPIPAPTGAGADLTKAFVKKVHVGAGAVKIELGL